MKARPLVGPQSGFTYNYVPPVCRAGNMKQIPETLCGCPTILGYSSPPKRGFSPVDDKVQSVPLTADPGRRKTDRVPVPRAGYRYFCKAKKATMRLLHYEQTCCQSSTFEAQTYRLLSSATTLCLEIVGHHRGKALKVPFRPFGRPRPDVV